MSNLWINIRIFHWHIQWEEYKWFFRILENDWHSKAGWPDGYFSVYQFFN